MEGFRICNARPQAAPEVSENASRSWRSGEGRENVEFRGMRRPQDHTHSYFELGATKEENKASPATLNDLPISPKVIPLQSVLVEAPIRYHDVGP